MKILYLIDNPQTSNSLCDWLIVYGEYIMQTFRKENVRCIYHSYGMKPKYYDKLLNSLSEHEYKKGQPIMEGN